MQLHSRAVDRKNTLSVIAVIKSLDHVFESGVSRPHRLQSRISRKGIVDIVWRARSGIDMHSVKVKRIHFILQLNILSRVIRFRPLPAAVRTAVDAELSVMEEFIFQLLSAFAAEDALTYLRTGNVIKDLFADAACHKLVSALFRKRIRQNIIAVDDQRRIRNTFYSGQQFVISNIHFTETVQLVSRNICEQRTVRFKLRKYADRRDFIHFDACKIRIQLSFSVCSQNKRRNNAVEHIRSGPVDDHFMALRLQRPAQDRIGRRLPVCSHGNNDLAPDLFRHGG